MSAIILAKDGYGWNKNCTAADEKGMYLNTAVVKTIYVDEQKINPVYIYWQCRVYNKNTSVRTITVSVTGLLNASSSLLTDQVYVPGKGSTLFTIEGYATGNVTVSFPCTGDIHIYPMNELGV